VPVGEGLVVAPELGGPRGRPRIPGSSLDEAAILAEDALIPREKIPTGPTAQLSLFGSANAEGRSFVFVIDRSNSMGGEGLGAITNAVTKAGTDRFRGSTVFFLQNEALVVETTDVHPDASSITSFLVLKGISKSVGDEEDSLLGSTVETLGNCTDLFFDAIAAFHAILEAD
jgi:hypothetical protein